MFSSTVIDLVAAGSCRKTGGDSICPITLRPVTIWAGSDTSGQADQIHKNNWSATLKLPATARTRLEIKPLIAAFMDLSFFRVGLDPGKSIKATANNSGRVHCALSQRPFKIDGEIVVSVKGMDLECASMLEMLLRRQAAWHVTWKAIA